MPIAAGCEKFAMGRFGFAGSAGDSVFRKFLGRAGRAYRNRQLAQTDTGRIERWAARAVPFRLRLDVFRLRMELARGAS